MENADGKDREFFENKKQLGGSSEVFIPLGVFRNESSGLEAISMYMKNVLGLRYCDIANLLNRDDRTIWGAFNSAVEKDGMQKEIADGFKVPVSIFHDRSLSVLEAVAEYLKEQHSMKYCRIAELLNRDQRTVWTVYTRAKKKRKNAQFN